MSNLLNKVKAKMSDHPNAVSEDTPHKPTSGVQDPPENASRNQLGQGGFREDEQEVRGGSITDENAASNTYTSAVQSTQAGGSQADAQQAMKNVEQDMGKEGKPLQ